MDKETIQIIASLLIPLIVIASQFLINRRNRLLSNENLMLDNSLKKKELGIEESQQDKDVVKFTDSVRVPFAHWFWDFILPIIILIFIVVSNPPVNALLIIAISINVINVFIYLFATLLKGAINTKVHNHLAGFIADTNLKEILIEHNDRKRLGVNSDLT